MQPAPALRIRRLFAVATAAVAPTLVACQTAQQANPPSPIEVLPQEALTTPVQPDEKIIAQELRAIEVAFARRACPQVMEHATRLEGMRKGKLSLPASTLLAFAVCESSADPKNVAKGARAITQLTNAQKNLTPAYSYLFLEELKGDIYAGMGNRTAELESKKRQREIIVGLDKVLVKINSDILVLSDGEAQLSADQRVRYQQALKLWPADDRLFDALKIVDDLLAEVVNSQAREKLLQTRRLILARIEEDFAQEAVLIESRLKEGREAEAKGQATRMRERFPRENYGRRIDAMLGLAPAAGSVAGATGAANSVSNSVPASGAAPGTSPLAGATGAAPIPADAATNPDAAYDAARRAIDAGHPDDAIRTLDSLPEGLQNDRTRRLRRESVDAHVRNTRTQVRNLYNRAGATTDATQKAELLRECKKLLEDLLARHPDAPGRSGIDRNLRTINQDLEGAAK